MQFSWDFFKGETREGFYIEPMMKCAWAVQMDILEDIQKLCKDNGIRYFADGGTLLGAVRHQGYIPWDDDIDIAMLRPDYDRFIDIIKREWKEKYDLLIPGVTNGYSMTFTKIYNTAEVSFKQEHLLKFHGFPYVTGIDIFPLDTIPNEKNEKDAIIQLYLIVINVACKIKKNFEEFSKFLPDIEELCKCKIDRSGDIEKQLCQLAEMISKSYKETNNSELTMFSYSERNIILKKEWYEDTDWKMFETMLLPVPKHYHEVLTAWYGDYMIPVQGGATHDYPFYKKQMKKVEEIWAKEIYGIDISNGDEEKV